MNFFFNGGWTRRLTAFMLCAFCFDLEVLGAEPQNDLNEVTVAVREADMARQAAEQRYAELSLVLVKTERELEKQRQRYADLYLKSQKLQEERDLQQLRIAALLLDESTAVSDEALANVMGRLDERQAEYQRLTAKVREFSGYLPTVLDTLNVSSALRQDVLDRYRELTRVCDRLEVLPPLVAGRGGEQGSTRECRVLSLRPDLGIAVLNAGSLAGVRAGSSWRVADGGQTLARLRVIELRSTLAAAVVVEGRVQRLAPGMRVVQGE
jgi:hypothetical protein